MRTIWNQNSNMYLYVGMYRFCLLVHLLGSERTCRFRASHSFSLTAVLVLMDMLMIPTGKLYHSTTNRIKLWDQQPNKEYRPSYLLAAHIVHETLCPDVSRRASPFVLCSGYDSPIADGEGEPPLPVEPAVATGETIPPLCGWHNPDGGGGMRDGMWCLPSRAAAVRWCAGPTSRVGSGWWWKYCCRAGWWGPGPYKCGGRAAATAAIFNFSISASCSRFALARRFWNQILTCSGKRSEVSATSTALNTFVLIKAMIQTADQKMIPAERWAYFTRCRRLLAISETTVLLLVGATHTSAVTHTHTNSLTHSLTLTHSLSHTHTHTNSLTHSHSHTHSVTHTHTQTHSLTHSLTLTHSLSLSLTHTHTHTHTHKTPSTSSSLYWTNALSECFQDG